MLDVKGDKSLWEKYYHPQAGNNVLAVEEDYYDGIVDMFEQYRMKIELLSNVVEKCMKVAEENGEFYSYSYILRFKNEIIKFAKEDMEEENKDVKSK